MKRFISSLGVALACLSFAHTTSAQMPFEYSTAANPKWYTIKSAMTKDDGSAGYATGQVFQINGMEKSVNYSTFINSSYQMFRFEQIAGQDSFKMINKKFPDGCLLSSGDLRYVARTYGAPKAGYVAWALESLGNAQYKILADDGIMDKGEDGKNPETPTPIRLHAQETGKVIVSWPEGEANSASAWTFEPIVEVVDAAAITNFRKTIDTIDEFLAKLSDSDYGNGVGQYTDEQFNIIWGLYEEMLSIDPSTLTYEELVQNSDRILDGLNNFKASVGKHTPILPQVSTAANPIWYLWRSDCPGDRKDRILTKFDDLTVKSVVDFDPTNPKQLWRLEKEGELYTLINKDGGCLSPKMIADGFVVTTNKDTACFNFKIYHQDVTNKNITANTMVVQSDSGQAVHLQNHGSFGTMTYGAGDEGSRFRFEDSAPLISDPIVFSTEGNDVWYYIKNKRQADNPAKRRPYLTSHGDRDTIFTRTSTDGKVSNFTYRIFGRSDTLALAAGDSAKWKFVQKEIDEPVLVDGDIVYNKVKKVLIINKLNGKCLNAFKHSNGKAITLINETESGDSIYPYWDVVDKTRDMWMFRSRRVSLDLDGNPTSEDTYANFDNSPGLVFYDNAGDAGSIYWLEKATDFAISTPQTPVDDIKIYVTDGKIVVAGTDETPSVYSTTGARVDAKKRLSQGVYVVSVGGKAAKVVVTK